MIEIVVHEHAFKHDLGSEEIEYAGGILWCSSTGRLRMRIRFLLLGSIKCIDPFRWLQETKETECLFITQ